MEKRHKHREGESPQMFFGRRTFQVEKKTINEENLRWEDVQRSWNAVRKEEREKR